MRRLLPILMMPLLLASLTRGEEAATTTAAAPSERPTRLAIIAGEGGRAPDAAAFGVIERNLLEMSDVAWVERDRVAIALKELALAATLDVSQRTLKLGRVLPADLFVFVESVSGSQPLLHCVSMVETRTGIVLSSWIGGQQEAQEPAALQAVVGLASAKARVPVGERRAFSLLGCHSDEPSRTLDPLAQTLGQLLMHDLGGQADCVVLDREHCQRLREEEALASVRQELAKSFFILECGVRRGDGPGQIAATVIIRSLQGAESGRVAVVLPANDLGAARRILAAAVTGSVGASAPLQAAISAQAEALAFQRMAQVLLSHDEGEEAARAAEVAYALAPSTDAAEFLAGAYGTWAYNLRSASPTTEEKRQMLTVQIRERELEYGVLEQRFEGNGTNRSMDRCRQRDSAAFEQKLSLVPGEEGIRDLLLEKIAWDRRINQYALDHSVLGSPVYFEELSKMIRFARHWTQTPQEFEDLYSNAFELYLAAPVCTNEPRARLEFLHNLSFSLAPNSSGPTDTEHRQAAARVFRWAAEEGAKRSDFPLQACALTALAQVSDDAATAHDAALRALDFFVRRVPIDHPDRNGDRFQNDDQWAAMMVSCALWKVTNRTDRLDVFEQILSPVIDSGDVGRLQAWWSRIDDWIDTLNREHRTKEALAICERAVHQMVASRPTDLAPGSSRDVLFREHRDLLARMAADLRLKVGVTSDKDGAPLAPVDIGVRPSGVSDLRAMERYDDDLVLVWTGPSGAKGTPLIATRVPAAGGAQKILGQATMPLNLQHQDLPVSAVRMNGQDVYIGMRRGGLLVLNANGSRLIGETNGLPGDSVRAVACVGGRVFVSVGQNAELKAGWGRLDYVSGALYEFDPSEQRFMQLASSRSIQQRHGLDGGVTYSIESLVPDEARCCLWLGVSRDIEVELWRFSLADGTFLRVPEIRLRFLRGLRTDGATILGATVREVFDLDLERNKVRLIDEGTAAYRWPCIRVAGSLVSIHYGDLRLDSLNGGESPVINRSVKGTTGFELRPAHLIRWNEREFLLGSADGRIWRITL